MAQRQERYYSLKDRYNYHAGIANSGKLPDGTSVSTVSRVQHAIRANDIRRQNNTFMKGVEFANKNNFNHSKNFS